MEFNDLVGKTIVSVKKKKLIGFDDDGFLEIWFRDGTKATIIASYGSFTGNSEDEYPTGIFISERYEGMLEDLIETT